MAHTIALAGNPNCGKTTLFNRLTGSRAHVGNWPGVTVERKEGIYKHGSNSVVLVDLPGIYSLSPYSSEEEVAREFLLEGDVELVINIIDATNLERNLYLTSQLMETNIPIIVALNMMDEVEAKGDKIDETILSKKLGIPVYPISASKGTGISEFSNAVFSKIKENSDKENLKTKSILEGMPPYIFASEIVKILKKYNLNSSFLMAIKLLEEDELSYSTVKGKSPAAFKEIETFVDKSKESLLGSSWDIMIADCRYKVITSIIQKCFTRSEESSSVSRSEKIDKILTHRIFAIPIFLGIMLLIFQITFGPIGSFFQGLMDQLINVYFAGFVQNLFTTLGASAWVTSLVVNGIIGGVGMVITFLPQIAILFFFLSILEDSGYISRAAFIMDKLLSKFGLSGKSFIPMLMGFGCSVPATMSARTIENEDDRKLTVMLVPFMSCSARLPVYIVFVGAFFAQWQGIVVFSLYLLGIVVAVISGIIFKHTLFKGATSTFIMELPPYRFPTMRNLFIHVWEKVKGFIVRAGTILLAASIVIWFLQSFSPALQMVSDPSLSIMGVIGTSIAPIFAPLGFGNWQASVALLTGFLAKEVVVSTMGILYGVGSDPSSLTTAIQSAFTPLAAYSYMAFVLLYLPCISAFAAMKKELGSWKWALGTVAYQTAVAWLVAFLIFQIGSIFIG